jgi:predicted kinase
MTTAPLVILSGSPGSGKTTIAERLAHRPGLPKVHIHSDDFFGYIKHGHIDPWLPESDRQNRMVMDIAASVAGQYARNGYMVLLDGVIRPWALPSFTALGLDLHYIVLRVDEAEAVGRCAARGGDSLTDPEVVANLHRQFASLDGFDRHVLSLAGLDREAALERVWDAIESGRFRL